MAATAEAPAAVLEHRDAIREAIKAPGRAVAVVAAPAQAAHAALRVGAGAAEGVAGAAALDPAHTRHVVVVMHGKRAEEPGLREAVRRLRDQGHQIAVRCTFDAGDARTFVDEALRLHDASGPRGLTLMAAGGDGTVNEVVCALLARGAPRGVALAVLPLGTANDFASALGISMDPAAALSLALDPSCARPIDVGLLNGHPFVNVALAGGVSAVSEEELSSPLKRLLGPLGIAIHVLKRVLFQGIPPTPGVTIRYPTDPAATPYDSEGVATLQGDLLLLAAGDCRQMGRAVSVCPDALLDDGLLDFTIAMGRLGQRAAEAASEAPCKGAGGASGGVRQLTARWLELSVPPGGAIPCNRDGEPEEASDRILFEVLPKRLLVHMPDDRLLTKPGGPPPLSRAGRVRRSALRALLAPAGAEGGEARARARLGAALRRAAVTAALLLAGAAVGARAATVAHRRREGERTAAPAAPRRSSSLVLGRGRV